MAAAAFRVTSDFAGGAATVAEVSKHGMDRFAMTSSCHAFALLPATRAERVLRQ
jgi:hypothetical protein